MTSIRREDRVAPLRSRRWSSARRAGPREEPASRAAASAMPRRFWPPSQIVGPPAQRAGSFVAFTSGKYGSGG